MPRIYKKNCKLCGIYYEKPNKAYCSNDCASNDPERIKKFTEFMRSDKNPNLGKKCKEEIKLKISQSEKGKVIGQETKEKIKRVVSELWQDEGYRERMRLAHVGKRTGERHWNWRGGITNEQTVLRHSFEHKQWSGAVLKRDDYTCQICGKRGGGAFHANHIKKFSDFPKLRFDINNGIALCEDCHMKQVNRKELEWESYFNFNLMARGFLPDNNWKEVVVS